MSNKLERRFVTAQLRMDSEDNGVISGYAALHYNGNKQNQSLDLGGFRERLSRGCFERAIAKVAAGDGECKCLFNHDPNFPLGSTRNGTMHISSDTTGLSFRCELGKQSYAQDIRESIRTGLVHQCSFGFMMDPDDADAETWGWDDDGEGEGRYRVRTINRITDLLDASPVVSPAYPQTYCGARTLWPNGEPASVVRALQHDADAQFAFARSQRRNLVNRLLGL